MTLMTPYELHRKGRIEDIQELLETAFDEQRDDWLTVEEIADETGIPPSAVSKILREEMIPDGTAMKAVGRGRQKRKYRHRVQHEVEP